MTQGRALQTAIFVLALSATSHAEEPEAWIATHAQAIRAAAGSASSEAMAEALQEASEALIAQRSELRKTRALDPLVAALHEVPTDAPLEVRKEVWRAAALSCHPAGTPILARALDAMGDDTIEVVHGLSEATSVSSCALVHAWFLAESERIWKVLAASSSGESEAATLAASEALRTAVGTVVPGASVVDGRRGAQVVSAALKAALKKAEGPLHHLLLTILAETPGGPTRKLIKTWMATKGPEEATMVAVLEALGRAGDAEAAPLLLDPMADATPPVLEACLVGLFHLPEPLLKDEGRTILTELFKTFDEEGRESGSLANNAKRTAKQQARLDALTARYDAWQTRRILDDPPTQLPEGATGVAGVNALIWRILDAGPKGIKPPVPPKDARPLYLNGRPNLPGRHWSLWWKNAR